MMAEKRADVASAVAAAVSPADSLFSRRIKFHLERKPYSPISSPWGSQSFNLETLNPSCSETQRATPSMGGPGPIASAAAKRSDGGLDPELSFRITFRRIGAGLANLGNTCFLNSVLQCLTYTEPFAAYLQSGKHKSSCRTAGFCAMCALQSHVMIALQSTGKILSPFHLVKNLRCISRNFRNSRQEDAHEYMVNLLESMHKCCLPSGVPTESPSAYEKSLVHKIFGGRLRSQVKCTQCHYCSNKFDPFLDLSLEILKADSLRKALTHFTAEEQLDGGERQYQCQRCKEKVRAYKQLTIDKAPYVLTIHLKRFGPEIPGQKIDKKVEFGPTLDLKPFVSDLHEADLKYTLYGVLVHAGWSTHSGHYYCFVRTSSGMWHSLDDNQVLQVSEKTVLAQKAYMLFYVRDRSSAIKKSVDVVRKDSILANVPGIKAIPQSASALNGAIQNCMEGRKLSISCSSAKSKPDISQGQPVSELDSSSGQSLSKDAAYLQRHNNTKPKKVPFWQNSGHTTLGEASCLQTNGEILSNGLHQTALSKANMKLPLENPPKEMPLATSSNHNRKTTEELASPSHFKDNSVAVTSRADYTYYTPQNGQISQGESRLSNGSNGKVESSILLAQPNNSGFVSSTSEKHLQSLLKQNSLIVNGGAKNGISQNNYIPYKMDSVSASASKEPTTVCSQSTHSNGHIGGEHFHTKPTDQNTVPGNDKCTISLQCENGGGSLLQLEESGLNTVMKMPSLANGCVQHGALVLTEREKSVGNSSQTELKQKKLAKSLLKGQYFGRKQLFLTSILHKKQQHKRSKKRRRIDKNVIKDKVQEDLNADDHGASTSEAGRVVDVASVHSSKKHSRSSSNKENHIEGVKDVKYCNGNSVHVNDRSLDRSSKNDVMLATSEEPRRPLNSTGNQCDAKEVDAYGKGSVQNGVMNLLMSLKETTVPRWDDIELPSSESFDLGDARSSNIGYVPDEWDEEYDRGRRKKVKKSKPSFGGPNPFQEFANKKIRQNMKMIVSGNQPLRI